jgi:hypothetical protein
MEKPQKKLKLKAGQVVVTTAKDRFGDHVIKATYIVASDYSGPKKHTNDLISDGVLLRKSGHEVFWSEWDSVERWIKIK